MKIIKTFAALAGIIFLQACSNTPLQTFARAVLNANAFIGKYNINYLEGMKSTYKERKSHTHNSAEEYLKADLVFLNESLEKVKKLDKTGDAKEMIEASEDFMEHSMKLFNNDYLNLAKMIDAKKPGAEVDAAINKIFDENEPAMKAKYERLTALAKTYAKKYDIKFIGA